MNVKVGADPEVFATKGGVLVNAHGLVAGSKEEPFPVNQGAVQVDGMALEFNIHPATDEEGFAFNIHSVMDQLKALIPEHELSVVTVAEFGEDFIKEQPLESQLLGCDPDFNAWTGEMNTPPNIDTPYRTAAGHVHIGWTEGADMQDLLHVSQCQAAIQQLDFYLGLPSLLFDNCSQRREMYGKAGAYRVKPYGVEYRVLSNQWLRDEELTRWVFRATTSAMKSLMEGQSLADKYGDIQEIINTSDVASALDIINQENLEVPNVSIH